MADHTGGAGGAMAVVATVGAERIDIGTSSGAAAALRPRAVVACLAVMIQG